MEKLQGPINPCLNSEDLEVGWLEEFINNSGNFKFEVPFTTEDGNFLEQDYYNFPNLENKMPFLQMLQSVETFQQQEQQEQQESVAFPALMQLEPNLQLLLRLQQQKVAYYTSPSEVITNNHSNFVDNNMLIMDDLHSPEVKSESEVHQVSATVVEKVEKPNKCNSTSNISAVSKSNNKRAPLLKTCGNNSTSVAQKEKKKRKRSTRPVKNKEEVENQRMTHIAVERNRRRQMNEHLNALRSLMPSSYVQRGDQASIIGGAIDFVKELEQMLQSLQAQKRMKQCEENGDVSVSSSSTSCSSNMHLGNIFTPFQLRNPLHSQEQGNGNGGEGVIMRKSNEEFSAEKRSALADIEVVVIQNHVNLKIQCQRRPGQLLRAIVAFEELRLTVLHLNITSLHTLVLYSFNLKIEDDCKLGTADEVARAVHQIFSLIHMS